MGEGGLEFGVGGGAIEGELEEEGDFGFRISDFGLRVDALGEGEGALGGVLGVEEGEDWGGDGGGVAAFAGEVGAGFV